MKVATRQNRRAAEAVLDAVRERPGITVDELADVIAVARSPQDQEAWGAPPSQWELAAAETVGERIRDAALTGALKGALTREQAATRLGVTAQAVSERRKAGKLTALRRGREWRFPAWQFGDDDVLPGLAELIASWPGTTLGLSTWAAQPAPDLGMRTPAQELSRRGGAERVLELTAAISAAAW